MEPAVAYLGLDYGRARTGVATSEDGDFVRADRTWSEPDPKVLLELIVQFVTQHQVAHVVLGLPLAQSGLETPTSRVVRSLARALQSSFRRAKIACQVHLWDERSTTKEAERAMRLSGKNARQQRATIDRAAAAVLLESWLAANKKR